MDQKSNPLRSSTSDGDSESTSSSSRSSSNKPKMGQASLTVSRLESMHAVQTMDADDVCQTAQHGMSKDRILSVLEGHVCDCGCSMPASDLYRICKTFWQLPKHAQDAVLWSIQSKCTQRRRKWSLEGPYCSCLVSHCISHS